MNAYTTLTETIEAALETALIMATIQDCERRGVITPAEAVEVNSIFEMEA